MYADNQQAGLAPQTPPMQGAGFQNPPMGGAGLSQGGQPASNPQMDMMKINEAVQMDPQASQKVAAAMQRALETGEITPGQLHQIVQLATACFNNPSLWPNVRTFVIRSGMCGPEDLPEQYDHGFVTAILIAAKAAESQGGAQAPQGGTPVQGGQPGPGAMPVEAAAQAGEGGTYTIPADVVRAKGKDFFDAMVRKYHTPNGYKE